MKKILICLILSLFLIGFVSAADLPKFNLPDGFDDVGDGIFIKYDSSKKPIQTFAIIEYTEHDAGDYLLNDSEYGYTIYNNTNALKGDDLDFNATFNNLLQFNKLNNITPINATEIIEQELMNQTNSTK